MPEMATQPYNLRAGGMETEAFLESTGQTA